MRKIKSTGKALEFLSKNQEGHFNDLSHIDYDIIKDLESSNCLIIDADKYQITQEGIDFYVNGYVNLRNQKRLFGLFPRLLHL